MTSGAWIFGSEGKYAVGPRTGRKPDVGARDRTRDRVDKAKDYAAFKVSTYVLVDPDGRSIEVLALERKRWSVVSAVTRGAIALPRCEGLLLDVDELWARVERLENAQ